MAIRMSEDELNELLNHRKDAPSPEYPAFKKNKPKAKQMANKGKELEDEVIKSNEYYLNYKIANVQKISTPWVVVREYVKGKSKIVSAFASGQSTLDFRGTLNGGQSISFECKESHDTKGLPLSHILEHQIEYMERAMPLGELTFIVCADKLREKRYRIPGEMVIQYWYRWKANKGKRGFNFIPYDVMVEVTLGNGFILDYLNGII